MVGTPTFPNVIMLIPYATRHSVAATGVSGGLSNSVYLESQSGYFNPMGKIEIEAAKIDSRYVHVRFIHTNKYWSQNNARDRFVVAVSKEPEEDKTKLSCTMFKPIGSETGYGAFQLIHVQSGGRVIIDYGSLRFAVTNEANPPKTGIFGFVDWETLVKVPQNVAFKGHNGMYLKALNRDGNPFLQFLSNDPNDQASGYHVEQQRTGKNLVIKSNGTGKFCRVSHHWILADSYSGSEIEALFEPFRVDNNTIALKNVSNHLFCRLLTGSGVKDCLNACAPTIINEARLEVHELVSERRIYNIKFRLDEARIYNQTPFVAGNSTLCNNTDQEAKQEVTVHYNDEKSYTFSRGFSATAGLTTSIQTGVPFFAEGKISISFEINGNFQCQWGTTSTRRFEVTANGSVVVPAHSIVSIKYVGTKGYCSIPYSYNQQDHRRTDCQHSAV